MEYDSRKIKGDIFIALAGHTVDGHDFIEKLLKKGQKQFSFKKRYTIY